MSEPLPELQDTTLDDAMTDQLFSDIEALCRVEAILVKDAGWASEAPLTLAQARSLLRARAVRGVQVRYVHEGAVWWDTLLVTPAGVRLVRIEHVAPPGVP